MRASLVLCERPLFRVVSTALRDTARVTPAATREMAALALWAGSSIATTTEKAKEANIRRINITFMVDIIGFMKSFDSLTSS